MKQSFNIKFNNKSVADSIINCHPEDLYLILQKHYSEEELSNCTILHKPFTKTKEDTQSVQNFNSAFISNPVTKVLDVDCISGIAGWTFENRNGMLVAIPSGFWLDRRPVIIETAKQLYELVNIIDVLEV